MARFLLNKHTLFALLTQQSLFGVQAFTILPSTRTNLVAPAFHSTSSPISKTTLLNAAANDDGPTEEEIETAIQNSKLSPEEVAQVGNLVQDDEWMGLGMELSELVRTAVVEEVKRSTSEFIDKDHYKVGDITKEIDSRVKDKIANMREKDEYELGDLTMALDEISKDMTCQLTGKDDYEFGDLTKELDQRVKSSVAEYCGKDEYEFGDLSAEIDRKAQGRILEFIGKDEYQFGDITREIENRRRDWISGFLGEEAAKNYQFGDVTKKALTNFTGKDEYEFGDVTKKIMGDLFGKRKRGGDKN